MENIRCFLAVDFAAFYVDSIEQIIRNFRTQHLNVKWIDPTAVHLTLNFFGSISQGVIDSIKKLLAAPLRNEPPFELYLKAVGAFPNAIRPRVLWLGIDGEVERLRQTKVLIDECLNSLPLPKEERAFKPHLTLGRFREIPRHNFSLPERVRDFLDTKVFLVKEIVLFRSELRPEGPRHTPLELFTLKNEQET